MSIGLLLFICAMVFLGGFIDSIAGGGGLISLPAYYAAGLPPALAAGTNKMSAFMGTAVATGRYAKKGYIPYRKAAIAAVGSFIGSTIGAWLFKVIPETTIRLIVLVAVPAVAVFILTRKNMLEPRQLVPDKRIHLAFFLIGMAIGLYDGLIGPGTGTFLQLLFVGVIGMSPLESSGTARAVNFAGNVAALISFILQGRVLYAVGIPAAFCGILGNYLGAGLAIKKGSKVIKVMLVTVLTLLMLKVLYDSRNLITGLFGLSL